MDDPEASPSERRGLSKLPEVRLNHMGLVVERPSQCPQEQPQNQELGIRDLYHLESPLGALKSHQGNVQLPNSDRSLQERVSYRVNRYRSDPTDSPYRITWPKGQGCCVDSRPGTGCAEAKESPRASIYR